MATLAGNTIASTYPLLLKIDSSGIDGTLRAVEDGDGTDSALSIATDSVLVKGDGVKLYFYDADGGEHISANTGGVLSIAGASEIDLTATAIDINGTVDMSSTLAVGSTINGVGINVFETDSILISHDGSTGTIDSAIQNTGLGHEVFDDLTSGDYNTGVGYHALTKLLSGSNNSALGRAALEANTTGDSNTAMGFAALEANIGADNNTAFGKSALAANTTGADNTAIGARSADSMIDGASNVAIGIDAIGSSTSVANSVAIGRGAMSQADVGTGANGSVAIGYLALGDITSGAGNTAVGYQSLDAEDDGDFSTAVGYQALTAQTGTTGTVGNTAVGYQAAAALTSATSTTAIGYKAGGTGTMTGSDNTLIGRAAGYALAGGDSNTIVGFEAGVATTAGTNMTIIGRRAGYANLESGAAGTVALGYESCYSLTSGAQNTGLGYRTLKSTDSGANNTAVGHRAGHAISNGGNNVCIGVEAGGHDVNLTTGDYNTVIGTLADVSTADAQNQIVIGYNVTGQGSNTAVIGNDSLSAFYVSSDAGATIHGGRLALGLARTDPTSFLDVIGGGAAGPTVLIDNTQAPNRMAELRIDGDNGSGDGGAMVSLYRDSGLKWSYYTRNNTTVGSAFSFALLDAGNDDGVYINQGGSGWTDASDERLKTSFVPIENAVDKLNTLQAINFKWKYGSEERQTKNNIGLLAQEVYEVFPEAVDYHDPEDFKLIDHPTIEGTKQAQSAWGIDKSKLIPVLVKAVQELSEKVKALEDA